MSGGSERTTGRCGTRGRLDAARALLGLPRHVARALVPAVVFGVVAGSTAGAVTIVALSGATIDAPAVSAPTGGDPDPVGREDDGAEHETTDPIAADEAAVEEQASGGESFDVDPAAPMTEGGGARSETSATSEPATPADVVDRRPASEGDAPDADTAAPVTAAPATEGDDEDVTAPAATAFADVVARFGPPDYPAILTRRFPGAQWSLSGSSYAGLTWHDDSTKPTEADLDALWAEVAEELAAERAEQAAAEARQAADRAAELAARREDPAIIALLDSFDPRTIWGPTPDYAHILSRRFPGAQWSLSGNDPEGGLEWHSDGPKPTKAQLDELWAEVAREMALEMDPKELERWAGTGEQIYVDGVLRPRGWVGGADDPQPEPVATPDNLRYLPQIPHTNGGSPVDSIEILKDPTGGQNFEQKYGIQLHELAAMIAAAHDYFGGSHGVGLSLNGDRELLWYSDQVDRAIVEQVLASIGALPEPRPED